MRERLRRMGGWSKEGVRLRCVSVTRIRREKGWHDKNLFWALSWFKQYQWGVKFICHYIAACNYIGLLRITSGSLGDNERANKFKEQSIIATNLRGTPVGQGPPTQLVHHSFKITICQRALWIYIFLKRFFSFWAVGQEEGWQDFQWGNATFLGRTSMSILVALCALACGRVVLPLITCYKYASWLNIVII